MGLNKDYSSLRLAKGGSFAMTMVKNPTAEGSFKFRTPCTFLQYVSDSEQQTILQETRKSRV
jgi:hypothetical protein